MILELSLLLICFVQKFEYTDSALNEKCFNQIYRDCTHETTFTAKEIQTTQLYLQKRFGTTSPIRPACEVSADKPPCIRKDIKCLTVQEREKLIAAMLQLYNNGVIDNMTRVHSDYWGANHKFPEGHRWHYWFSNQYEKELQKIDPSICLPYWNYFQEFTHPENSIFWEIFGHSGNADNDYCVTDGPFANITLHYPNDHCLKREWSKSPFLDPWKSPEYHTMAYQMPWNPTIMDNVLALGLAQTTPEMLISIRNELKYLDLIADTKLIPFAQRVVQVALVSHFDTHLSIGGWNGDMSSSWAPNDPIFHIMHIMGELDELFWQLSNNKDYYLVPKSYNGGMKYDNTTASRRYADIDSDTFNYYSETYVKEGFQFGYGDMCHLYDVIIKPINDIVNKNLQLEAKYPSTSYRYKCVPNFRSPLPQLPYTATLPNITRPLCKSGPLPTAAQRLKDSLSPSLFKKYFPKFARNKWSFFDHIFYNISADCNPHRNGCERMRKALPYAATLEGQRQYKAFTKIVADFDITAGVDAGETAYYDFMDDLNDSGYCSPYV